MRCCRCSPRCSLRELSQVAVSLRHPGAIIGGFPREEHPLPHIVLLGDSTLDNAAYTDGGPDVVAQLRAVLPPGWEATLAAVDGATTRTLGPQLAAIPAGATHLVLSRVLARGLPTVVCTIYEGCFPDPAFQRFAATAAALFDDAILCIAREHALPTIDLRQVCVSDEDYVNSVEPSAVGGGKIARAIGAVMGERMEDVRR